MDSNTFKMIRTFEYWRCIRIRIRFPQHVCNITKIVWEKLFPGERKQSTLKISAILIWYGFYISSADKEFQMGRILDSKRKEGRGVLKKGSPGVTSKNLTNFGENMWVLNNCHSSTLENLEFYIKFLLKIGKGTGSHRKGVHSISQRKVSFWGKRRRTKTLPRHSISPNKGWLKVETKATNNTNRSLYCVATTTTCSSTAGDRDHSESCYQHERDRPSCRSTKFLAVTRA